MNEFKTETETDMLKNSISQMLTEVHSPVLQSGLWVHPIKLFFFVADKEAK